MTAPPRHPLPPSRADRAGFVLYAGHLLTLFGIALSNVFAGLLLLSAPWTLRRGWRTWHRRPAGAADRALRVMLAALVLYIAFLVLAIAASYDPRASARALRELFILITLPLGLLLVRGERRVRRVVDGLVLVATAVAVWGLVQTFAGYGGLDRRIRGPFSHWMTFSGFLLICDLLLLATLLFSARRLWRGGDRGAVAWRLAALVAINAALLGSLTRSAWLGAAVGVVLAAGLRSRRSLLLAPVAALVLVAVAPVPVLQRVLSTGDVSDVSNYDRLCMTAAGLAMIAERPVTGVGPRQVEPRYPIYRVPGAPRYRVPHLHDSFLQLAAERGLPTLAVYLVLMAAPLVAAFRLYRRQGGRNGPRADLLVGTMAALVAFNVAGLFEYNWGDTEVQRLVLFVMALPFCIAGEADEEAAESGDSP